MENVTVYRLIALISLEEWKGCNDGYITPKRGTQLDQFCGIYNKLICV